MRAQRGDVVTNDELRRVKRCISAGRAAAAAAAAGRGIAAQMATTVLDQNLRVSLPSTRLQKKHTTLEKLLFSLEIQAQAQTTKRRFQISDFGLFKIGF